MFNDLTPYRTASRDELEEQGWYLTRNFTLRHPDNESIEIPLTDCSKGLILKGGVYYYLPAGVLPVEPYVVITNYNCN